MNPFNQPYMFPTLEINSSASFSSFDLSSTLRREIQIEREKTNALRTQVENEKLKSKELEDHISLLLSRKKAGLKFETDFKNYLKSKRHIKTKQVHKYKNSSKN